MPDVEIPDVGLVAFPDSMTEADIANVIETKIIPRPSMRAAPVQPPGEGPTLGAPLPEGPTQAFPVQQERATTIQQEREHQATQTEVMRDAVATGQVQPAQIGVARATLPRVTSEEVATLLPRGTPPWIPKVAAAVQQGAVAVPEGFLSEWGLAAGLAGPVGRVPAMSKAVGEAFVLDIAKSIPEKAREMLGAYQAGDVEGGTRALTELVVSSGIVGAAGKNLATRRSALPRTAEVTDAIQKRSGEAQARTEARPEVGEQVRIGEQPALPQVVSESRPEPQAPQELVGDVKTAIPVESVQELPATENGGRIAIILPDGKAVVGGRIHADTWNRAIEAGVTTDAQLSDGFAGFVKPDGTAWGVNGKPLPKVSEVFIVGRETPKPPARPDQRPPAPGENKPVPPSTEQAPQVAAPPAATVSEAKPPGVTAPEVPPAISEATIQPKPIQAAPEVAYDASLATFRDASRKFRKAQQDYRSKKIGDTEFLAAQQEFKAAESIADKAERDFIDAKNETGADIGVKEARSGNVARVETPVQAAAKVSEEVKSVAKTEGQRPAKEIKSELVERLEKAVADSQFSTEDYFPGLYVYEARTLSETTRLTDRPVEGTRPLKDWLESPMTKRDKTPNRETMMGEKFVKEALEKKGVGKITIDIPGDGSFTIWNTKDALGTVLARAKKITTTTSPTRGFSESKPTKEQGKQWAEEAREQSHGIVGMGGAVPGEFVPESRTATGIKNAAVDEARARRGLEPMMKPARLSQQTVWDRVMAKIDAEPAWQDNLIAELKQRSRNLSQDEILALDHRYADLQNEYAKATRDGAQAYQDGRLADLEDIKARTAGWQTKLAELEEIAQTTGTEWGRAGAMRQRLLREDFTLEGMERNLRAAKGFKPLTDAERASLTQKAAEFERVNNELESKLAEKDRVLAEAQMARTMAEMQAAAAKQQAKIPDQIQRIITRIGDVIDTRANAARERLRGKLFTMSPDVLKDLAEVGASNIYHVGLDFAKWSARMAEDIGERIKPHLEAVWKESVKLFDQITDKVAGKANTPEKRQAIQRIKTPEEKAAEVETKVREAISDGDADLSALARKLARAFYTNGIRERELLINAVHDVFSDVLPDWTRRQTMDAISGYGSMKPLSKDEISVGLRDLKGQMQQLAKLEDMAARKAPLKTGIERRIPSDVERELIKQVNEAKRKGGYETTDPNTQLRSALDTVKTRLRNQITDFERRLREKDFHKKTKTEIELDKQALDLQHRRQKIKDAFYEEALKAKLAEETGLQRLYGNVVEAGNMVRAFMTSAEFSAVLRQGKFIGLMHPLRAAKSLKPMFEAFASEKGAFKVKQDIENRPNYPIYQKSKLFLSERGGSSLVRMEEEYRSRLARKLPIIGPIIKGSERAYTTFLNKLRADSFDAMSGKLSRHGTLTLDEAKIISNAINVWTGRGTIAMAEHAGGALNAAFFAPRLVASRFQTLLGQPIWHGAISGKVPLKDTGRVRAMIAGEYARLIGAYGVLYTLVNLSDIGRIGTDRNSSDFGKIIIGKTRIDPLAGLSQVTVLISRLTSGKASNLKGETSLIRGNVKYGDADAADVIARFLRTKLAPVPSLVVDVATGKDVTGNPVTPGSLAVRSVVPITYQDVLQTMEDQGIPRGTALLLLGIFGESVNTFNEKK